MVDPWLLGQRQMNLVQTLILNLRNKGVNKSARDLADALMGRLLRQCGSLLWRPVTLAGLLEALDARDSSGYQVDVDSRVISWLRKVGAFRRCSGRLERPKTCGR